MKRSTLLKFIIVSILLLWQVKASAQLNISIQILPPYPTKFTEYASRPQQMIIALTNTSTVAQRVQLRGAINGDNGITVRSKAGYKSRTAIELSAGQTKTLNGSDIAYFFDYTDLEYSGITQNDFIHKGGLPEGRYQVCIRAYNYDNNEPLSPDEPGGCSNVFSISSLEPPVILSPMADQVIPSGPGQIFSIRWNTPLSSPPGLKYRIRMVEILGDRNPNDAIMSATQPYFFEKEVMTNMYIYNPADPQLTPGRKYALMVEAFDPFGNAVFRNNGRSEVTGFEYGKPVVPEPTPETVAAAAKKDTLTLDGRIVYRYDGVAETHPYTGKVYLYKSYILKDTTGGKVTEHKLNASTINAGENEMVGSADADQDGKLHMVFATDSELKIPDEVKKAYPQAPILSAVYSVRLANPYLENPQQAIVFTTKAANVGELTAIPYAYALKVNVKKGYAKKGTNGKTGEAQVNESTAGLRTVIYRKEKSAVIPWFEGAQMLKASEGGGDKMLIVAEDTTREVNENGKSEAIAAFDNLLVSKTANDTYWIAVFKPNSTEKLIDEPFKFEALTAAYAKLKTQAAFKTPALMQPEGLKAEKVNAHRYNVMTSLTWVSTDPPLAKLRGRLLYRYKDGVGGARPLANKSIKLVPVYVLSNPLTREQYVLSGTSSIVPVGSNNQKLQGEPEKNWTDLPKITGDIDGVAGATGADGLFVMNEIPLWDSVSTFTGSYNIRKPILKKPIPEKLYDADRFKNPMEAVMTDARDSRINPATGGFNPMEGYGANSPAAVGGGVSGLNSPSVVIGGDKTSIINQQVNAIQGAGPAKVGAIQGINQRGGPLASPAQEIQTNDDDGEFVSSTPMTLQRCYRVVVNHPYYLSPENNIYINPLDSIDAGTLYSDVRSYKARVTVIGKDDKKRLANVKLLLKRSSSYDVPQGEAEQVPERRFDEKGKTEGSRITVDQLFTQMDSTRNVFSHVLYQDMDSHNIIASTNDTANTLISYKETVKQISPYWSDYGQKVSLTGTYNNEYTEPTVDFRIEMQPKNPVIAGRILNTEGTKGISGDGVQVTLVTDKNIYVSVPVDKDGYFVFTRSYLENITNWQLSVSAWGYDIERVENPPANSTVTVNGMTLTSFVMSMSDNYTQENGWASLNLPPMSMGQKIFKNFYFKPQSQIKGKVANANGQPIPALYKVESTGSLEETRRMCSLNLNGNAVSRNIILNGTQPNGNTINTKATGNAKKTGNTKPAPPSKNAAAPNNIVPPKDAGKTQNTAGSSAFPQIVFNGSNTSDCVQEFNAKVAAGKPAEIIIIPNDLKYFNDTLRVTNPVKGITDIGTRTLITREHRFAIHVRGIRKNGQIVPIPNAVIKILDSTLVTNSAGLVKYQFANISQNNFWFKVTPPAGSPFVVQEATRTNEESKGFKDYYIDLPEGDAVWGKVTLAGNPVSNAEVSVSQGTNAPSIITKTAADGTYRINAVKSINTANQQVEISASAGAQANGDFVAGQQKQAAVNTEVNFELSGYNELDISKLLGYDVKVTGISKENGKTYLSGELMMPASSEFKPLDESIKLTFSKVAIKANTQNKKNAKGLLYAEPEGDIKLDNASYKTRLGKSYNVMIGTVPGFTRKMGSISNVAVRTSIGINVKKQGALNGAINGKARLVDNSFNFPESYLKFGDSEFYLAEKTGTAFEQSLLINGTSGTEYNGTPAPAQQHTWYFSNASGESLQFKFLGFSAQSKVNDNFYNNGRIRIKPEITAAVETPDNKPLVITMPEIFFSSDKIEGVSSTQPLEFGLENWKVRISKWKVATEEGGILALGDSENYVSTTAGVNISFKTFRLRNDELLIDNVNLSSVKLGGIKDLKVNPGNVVFGLDNRTGNDLKKHFVLRLLGQNGQTAGQIAGLPGFAQALDLQAVTLISNGEQYIDFAANSAAVKVYNAINFTPIALESSQGGFRLAGNMDLGIPNLNEQYGGFLYTAGPLNSLKSQLDLKDVKLDIGTGYVQFASLADPTVDNGKKILSTGHLEIWGTVTEPGKLDKIPVKLVKAVNGQQTTITMEQRPAVFAMKMGGDEKMVLNVSRTWTRVENNKWDYLQFAGKFDERYQKGGMGNDSLVFKVYGEISLDDTQIKLKDIKTPVGNLSVVFDWAKREMRGTMEIQLPNGDPIDIPGGIKFKGMAEVLAGVNGFYFLLAGDVNVQSVPLIFPLSAGILIAYHDNLPKEVFDKTSQYMYHKTYPCGMENGGSFKGFMLAGRKNVIDPVNFKIDVGPILKADVNLEVGFDATFYGNFSNGIEVSFTPGVFGDIQLGLSSVLSCTDMDVKLQLSAMGRFLAEIKNDQASFTGALCMSLHLEGKVLQRTPALIPGLCIDPVLLKIDEGFTIGGMFGLRASTGPGGGIEPFFKVIKSPCSENMNLLCNQNL